MPRSGRRCGTRTTCGTHSSTQSKCRSNFDPAIGFVSRRGYRQYSQRVEFGPRPANHPYIRQVTTGIGIDNMTDLQNNLLKRNIDSAAGPSAISLAGQFQGVVRSPLRTSRYALRDRAARSRCPSAQPTPCSRYRFFGSTANRRRLAVYGSIEIGQFYSGTQSRPGGQHLAARPPGAVPLRHSAVEQREPAGGALHHAPLPDCRRNAVLPVHRARQQHPVRLAKRASSAGSRASAGSSRPVTISTSCTRTTGWTTRCSIASRRSTSVSRRRSCTPTGSDFTGRTCHMFLAGCLAVCCKPWTRPRSGSRHQPLAQQ